MNLWYNLPDDLRYHILLIRKVLFIQRNIRTKLARINLAKIFATEIIKLVMPNNQLQIEHPYSSIHIDTMDPAIAARLEYCAVHSGREVLDLWADLCYIISEGLFFDQYTDGPGSKYYIRCEQAVFKLVIKHNIT